MKQTLDPLVSVAFSLRASPGVYAILLGSGISRAAGIPTGWEVVLDLISRMAAAQGEDTGGAPDLWYANKFGAEPHYSEILNAVCKTRSERQQLLKSYFEPTETEREQAQKLPTAAHHAVAEMMAAGAIRIVITTNFDRLLEQALEARGIVPTVIGSPDQARGMIPLAHQKHCIIKVHGDYLDTRILNTSEELSSYAPEMAQLIDRVFDEFGLIVSGWSGTWDTALRASMLRSPNRRFAYYWSTVGESSEEAKNLIADRGAVEIASLSADAFFTAVLSRLRGLEEFDRPHPLSVKAAVGAAKRYLVDDGQRIRLHDLYLDALSEAKAIWGGPSFPPHGAPPTAELFAQRVKAYDASSETVVALTSQISRWSIGGAQDDLLCDAVRDAAEEGSLQSSQYVVWGNLRTYPASLLWYSAGMGSLLAGSPRLLSKLLTAPTPSNMNPKSTAVQRLIAPHLAADLNLTTTLFSGNRRWAPMSDWLHDALRPAFLDLVSNDADYTLLFDTFEFYVAVTYVATKTGGTGWAPVGGWGYRQSNHTAIVEGLNGIEVRFGGKAFAEACNALTNGTRSLVDTASEVSAFRSKLPWY